MISTRRVIKKRWENILLNFFPGHPLNLNMHSLPIHRHLWVFSPGHASTPSRIKILPNWTDGTTTRCFARISDDKDELLVNEKLIASLMTQTKMKKTDDVQVRIIIETIEESEAEGPPKITVSNEVVTLTQAINTSLDRNMDLIEVALGQEVPVVRLGHLSSFLYKKMRKTKNSAQPPQLTKEVRVKGSIASHDLQRKVDDMVEYLNKNCIVIVNVRCGWRELEKDPEACAKAVDRILQLVEDAELVNPPTFNPEKTTAQFQIRAVSRKKKS